MQDKQTDEPSSNLTLGKLRAAYVVSKYQSLYDEKNLRLNITNTWNESAYLSFACEFVELILITSGVMTFRTSCIARPALATNFLAAVY